MNITAARKIIDNALAQGFISKDEARKAYKGLQKIQWSAEHWSLKLILFANVVRFAH